MPIASIRRRIGALEAVLAGARIPEYAPLTYSEITGIAQRVQAGETPSGIEVVRLERQSPIIDGELLMTCHRGQVIMKRYLGVDLAQL